MIYSSHHERLRLLLLDLFLFYALWCYYKWNCFVKISFSNCLLLAYNNTVDFLIITLYFANLLNSLNSSISYLVDSLGFYIYKKIITSASRNSFICSFLIFVPFISFSCLHTMARTSNTKLNRSESKYPCLVS